MNSKKPQTVFYFALSMALVLSFLISQKALAFQDACITESQIASGLNSIYSEELSKAMTEAKLLDPQIEELNKKIKEIEEKVALDLTGVSPSRIRLEQYDKTKDLRAQLDSLLGSQTIIMKRADIYKFGANNALSKLYICRYNTLQILLEELNKYGLTAVEKVSILEQALYYSDNQEQRQVIEEYLAQLKSINTGVIIQTKSEEKSISPKEKRILKLKEIREKRLARLKALKEARALKTKNPN